MFKKAPLAVSSIALALSVVSCSAESTPTSTSERTNFPDKIVEAELHHTDIPTSEMVYLGMMFCLEMYEGSSYTELRDEFMDEVHYGSITAKQVDSLLEISHEFYCPEIEKS